VKVVAGSLVQLAEVRSGGSYLSQNDLRIHVGLASAEKVGHIEIRWPGGPVELLQNIPADHLYYVREGQGIVPPDVAIAPHPARRR